MTETTYAQVVERALLAERADQLIYRENAARRESKKAAQAASAPQRPRGSGDQKRKTPDSGSSARDSQPRGRSDQRQSGSSNWRDHPYCEKCRRRHLGECKPRACYNCGSHEHLRRNCTLLVKGDRKTDDTLIPARVFALTEPAAAESKTVVAGQLTSAGTSLTVLFDSGQPTHLFLLDW